MANRIAGITIEIEGNTTKLSKALSGVNKEIKTTQSQLKDVEKLLKLDPGNTELLKQKQELLAKAVKDTQDKLKLEKEALEQLKAGDQTPELVEQQKALERQIVEDESALKSFTEESKTFGSVASQQIQAVGGAIKEVGDKISAAGEKVKSFGEGVTKNVTVPIAAAGGATLAAFNEVDKGADIVIQKTGATGEAAEELQTSMKNLATSIPTDFETAGEAIGEVNTRFGLTGDALEDLSGQFIKFAQLNNTDVSTSIDGVQKAMAAYGLDADHAGEFLDRLNKTGQETGVSVDKLTSGLVANGAAFQEMGLSIDQSTYFMGLLEKSGANSETVLNGMRKALKNATAEGKPLDQALGELQNTILNGTGATDGLTAAYDLFGKSGDQIYAAVKNGTLDFQALGQAASDASGSVSTTFEATLDPADKFKLAMNDAKVAGAEIGATLGEVLVPVIETIRDVIADLKAKWDELSPETQQAIVKAALIVAAIGPIITIVGTLITSIGSIISLGGTLITGIGTLVGVLGGPLTIAIAAIIAIGVLLYKNWDEICKWAKELKEKVSKAWEDTKTKVTNTVNNIKNAVVNKWNEIKNKVSEVANNVKNTVSEKFQQAKDLAVEKVTGLKDMVGEKLDAIKQKYEENGGGIKGIVSATVEGLKQYWTLGLDTLNELTGGKLQGISDGIKNAFDKAVETVQKVVDKLKGLFDFEWKLPKIKLPHLSVWGRLSLNPPSVPHFSISWYKKAYDTPYLFTEPTVIGGRGFGDGGGSGEIVYGRDQLMRDIAAATSGEITINVYASPGMNVNQLADKVQQRLAQTQRMKEAAYA